MIKNFSDKDKKDWEEFISNRDKLHDKDERKINNKNYQIKSLDLHGYTLDQANKKVEKFITQSYEQGINKLIIITGKGLHSENESNPYVSKELSILKYSVPEFILKNKNLMKLIFESSLKADIKNHGSTAIQWPPTPTPGLRIFTLGCLFVKLIKSQIFTFNFSEIIDNSLAKDIWRSRYEFSASLHSSAVLASVSSISPLTNFE